VYARVERFKIYRPGASIKFEGVKSIV